MMISGAAIVTLGGFSESTQTKDIGMAGLGFVSESTYSAISLITRPIRNGFLERLKRALEGMTRPRPTIECPLEGNCPAGGEPSEHAEKLCKLNAKYLKQSRDQHVKKHLSSISQDVRQFGASFAGVRRWTNQDWNGVVVPNRDIAARSPSAMFPAH